MGNQPHFPPLHLKTVQDPHIRALEGGYYFVLIVFKALRWLAGFSCEYPLSTEVLAFTIVITTFDPENWEVLG